MAISATPVSARTQSGNPVNGRVCWTAVRVRDLLTPRAPPAAFCSAAAPANATGRAGARCRRGHGCLVAGVEDAPELPVAFTADGWTLLDVPPAPPLGHAEGATALLPNVFEPEQPSHPARSTRKQPCRSGR